MPVLIRFLAFTAISLIIGLGSAWVMVDRGFFAVARSVGPWVIWKHEGALEADPYTLARVARSGSLPMTSASRLTYTATQDSEGYDLNGSCTYEIAGRPFPAVWWNIAAFTKDGETIENKAKRYAFNSGNLLVMGDGRFVIRMSPHVQPGNWLPSAENRAIVLRISILRPINLDRILNSGIALEFMPGINRIEC